MNGFIKTNRCVMSNINRIFAASEEKK